MSDLISRQAVIDIIHKEIESTTSYMEHKTQINIEFAVKELPTAYDVEKVVAELEQYATSPICKMHKEDCPYRDNYNIACENCGALGAIDIVKRGGVE